MADLATTLETILSTVKQDLEVAVSSGLLSDEGIVKVVRGDRFRGSPVPTPSVWFRAQPAIPVRDQYGFETWEMPIEVAGLVSNPDPEVGGSIALRIAAHAQRVALDIEAEDVFEVASDGIDPTTRANPDNKALAWVMASVRVKFSVNDGRQ